MAIALGDPEAWEPTPAYAAAYQVRATTAPHTAQLNVLAEASPTGPLDRAERARSGGPRFGSTAPSTTGPELPRATAPVTADMSMDTDA